VTTRYGADRAAYADWLAVHGHPRYRADQVWQALTSQRRPLEDATNLPVDLRAALAEAFPLALRPLVERRGDGGDTIKWLLATHDGLEIETVLMVSPDRATACVSSQAGCAMGCTFCATGQAGFDRHLDVGEIVEQVAHTMHHASRPVTNVVFMGMGEPMANFGPTWDAVTRLHDDFGISARRITVSTVGVVPGMRRMAQEQLPVTLAVSLHAPNDKLRDTMIPINARYPVREVVDAAHAVARRHGRRVTFEYACIEDVNDAPELADELAELLAPLGPLGAHVNLIPLNPTDAYAGRAAPPPHLRAFAARLAAHGLTATIRRNRGTDIEAACGQLRERAHRTTGSPSTRMVP
jgi:23S rRNA (adenine2503-C2)-methyltransferase